MILDDGAVWEAGGYIYPAVRCDDSLQCGEGEGWAF